VHTQSRETYGSPRVYRELQARGLPGCQNTVAKLMRQHGVHGQVRRRFRLCSTDSKHPYAVFDNLLQRQFHQERPNQAWVADISYVPTDEGWLYLAAIIDLYSRRVVGWATAEHLRAELACQAFQMALLQRQPSANLMHHSDRGVQYASDQYQSLLAQHQIRCSMSRVADCYDNAVMESFFATLKCELVYRQRFATRQQARLALFDYIEVFYNRQRRHSSLGYLSPEQFEAAA
jgi:transposase InsO family protein